NLVTTTTFESRLLKQAVPAALMLLLLSCLVLTASRGGIFSAIIGLCVFAALLAVIGRLKLGNLVLSLVALALGAGSLLLLRGQLAVERFGAMVATDDSRAAIFSQVWRAIQAAPLQGFGLGSFAELKRLLLEPTIYAQIWAVRDVHNVYLQWLLDTGVAG